MVIDEEGRRLLSRRVANHEIELLALLGDVLGLGDKVTWAMDLVDGGVSLLLTPLLNHGRMRSCPDARG